MPLIWSMDKKYVAGFAYMIVISRSLFSSVLAGIDMIRGSRRFGELFINCRHSNRRYIMTKEAADANPTILTGIETVSKGQGKLFASMSEVVHDVFDGAKLLIGGFGTAGVPENLLNTILDKGTKDLTIVANNPGLREKGIGKLIKAKRVKKMIGSYIAENAECQRQYLAGEIEVELTPQGTMVERIRAGGAGIPAFYTPTGYGTIIQEGNVIKYDKEGYREIVSEPRMVQEFDGRNYVLEKAITGDFAIIRAWKADKAGNLIFRRSSRNFNPTMSKAAKVTIVEAEEIVEIGQLDPDHIHLPGIFVDRIVQGHRTEKLTELVIMPTIVAPSPSRDRILRRAGLELKDGMYVNLGIGLPIKMLEFVPKGINITFHSENGLLGIGGNAPPEEIDPDVMNAGKFPVTIFPGASAFSSEDSFGMIRGNHLDIAVLGAIQVSQKGDLANWMIPGKAPIGMGGAMDLVSASKTKVIITMFHTAPDGTAKILKNCTIPLTGQHCVDMIITELGVFEVDMEKGLNLIEIAPNVDVAEIVKSTGCEFSIANDLKVMSQVPIDDKN